MHPEHQWIDLRDQPSEHDWMIARLVLALEKERQEAMERGDHQKMDYEAAMEKEREEMAEETKEARDSEAMEKEREKKREEEEDAMRKEMEDDEARTTTTTTVTTTTTTSTKTWRMWCEDTLSNGNESMEKKQKQKNMKERKRTAITICSKAITISSDACESGFVGSGVLGMNAMTT